MVHVLGVYKTTFELLSAFFTTIIELVSVNELSPLPEQSHCLRAAVNF